METFIGRRVEFGLRVDEEYLWQFILRITRNEEEEQEWQIECDEDVNFFPMSIIVVEGIGWVNWKSVFEQKERRGKLTRNMLIPFEGHVLMFPWEVVEMEQTTLPAAAAGASVLLPWNRDDPHLADINDINLKKNENRELELITRFIHYGEIGTIAPDICLQGLLSEKEIMSVVVKQLNKKVSFMDPTELDITSFIKRHGITIEQNPLVVLPHVVLVVPWEECPALTPVYEGLRVHVTYKDCEKWLRTLQQHSEQVIMPKRIYQSTNGNPITFQDGQFKYLKPATAAKAAVAPVNTKRGCNSTTTAARGSGGAEIPNLEIDDIEDLMKALPPCLKNVISKNTPFKDGERFHLARQFYSGHVSEAVCEKVYENSGTDYNWKYVYEKKYVGALCSEFIENAQNKTGNTIHCPYATMGEENPQQCCTRDFGKMFPTKLREGEVLKRPYQAMLWYKYRK